MPETESFARPDISTKVSDIILSQLSKITRWKNNRVCGASVKCRLANTCAIFSRSIEQHAQRRNLNMGLVAKGDNPVWVNIGSQPVQLLASCKELNIPGCGNGFSIQSEGDNPACVRAFRKGWFDGSMTGAICAAPVLRH